MVHIKSGLEPGEVVLLTPPLAPAELTKPGAEMKELFGPGGPPAGGASDKPKAPGGQPGAGSGKPAGAGRPAGTRPPAGGGAGGAGRQRPPQSSGRRSGGGRPPG